MAEQGTFLRRAGWGMTAFAGAVVLLAAWFLREILLLAFAGVLVAVLLRAPAEFVSARTRIPAGLAVVLTAFIIVGALAAVFLVRGDAIAEEVGELRRRLPEAAAELQERVRGTTWGRQLLDRLPSSDDSTEQAGATVARAGRAVSSTLVGLGRFLLVLYLGLVMAIEPRTLAENGVKLVRPERRARAREILAEVTRVLRRWLVGRLVSMAIIGVATFAGLALLGVPLAFPLALLAALLTFIPNLGPILAAVPAILLAFSIGPKTALSVAFLYLGVQAVESYLIEPVVERKTVLLPAALCILVQLSMALVAGLLGVAVATPLLAVIVVLMRMLYVEDGLGDMQPVER